ncbi:VOC family protein [Branchiibius cervicis]|uniref:VOC family protein n=1 Tax=Branchiibius cervicis TaxID=908252 RepID=A0ABW2AP55_9MICO
MAIRGRIPRGWLGVVLDAPDARALAHFYSDLLGWPLADDEPDWCSLQMPDLPVNLAFQTEAGYVAPTWPSDTTHQQMQLHLDLEVDDLAGALEDAVALGARPADFQPQHNVRVMFDPVGHPFCLYDNDLPEPGLPITS